MGKKTAIGWTNSTVSFWWGCTKVGPGCDHCYAEAWDKRCGGNHWGTGVPRRKIKSAVALLHRLDNQYAEWAAHATCAIENAKALGLPVPNIGTTRRVFIQSMSDLFDLEVPVEWFAEAWRAIEACDWLAIQIVTKRISAVEKRLAEIGATAWPKHAGLIITVCNQAEADRDIPRLLALKAKLGIPWVGVSIEPMLGPIDLESAWHNDRSHHQPGAADPHAGAAAAGAGGDHLSGQGNLGHTPAAQCGGQPAHAVRRSSGTVVRPRPRPSRRQGRRLSAQGSLTLA